MRAQPEASGTAITRRFLSHIGVDLGRAMSDLCDTMAAEAGEGVDVRSSMQPPPMPGDSYQPGMFRLPGFGGAALFLRSSVVPALDAGGAPTGVALSCDIGLLSPNGLNSYFGRIVGPGMSDRLSVFFLAAASQPHPQDTLAPLTEQALGLRFAVTDSDPGVVTVLVSVDMDDEAAEPDGLDFETSRSALAQAAISIRYVEHVEDDPGGLGEPPVDWARP